MKQIIIILILIFFAMIEVTAKPTIQTAYRWRHNDGNEETANWRAPQNVPIYFEGTDVVRLRVQEYYPEFDFEFKQDEEEEISQYDFNQEISLFYSLEGEDTWVKITDDDSNAFVLYDSGNGIDVPTTPQLNPIDYYWTEGVYFYTSKYDQSHTIEEGQYTEYEWSFQPTANAIPSVYYFVKGWGTGTDQQSSTSRLATMYYDVPMPAIPLRNWAIYSSLILLVGFMGYRFGRFF